MSITQIKINTDNNLNSQAQAILDDLGLDMTTAFNLFLRQVVYKEPLPFIDIEPKKTFKMRTGVIDPAKLSYEDKVSMQKSRIATRDIMKGEIWMSDDFDAPLDDMEEYMP